MCEPPPLAFSWSGGFLFQNQIFEWTAKSRKRWFSSFLWSLSNVKIIEYLTKTSYARLYALWLGSWASTTTLAVKPLAVDTFFMLVGMVYAVSSHFVDVFYKFLFHLLFVFLRIIFSIAMESPASFLDGFILSQKTALVSEKSKKSRIYFRSFHPPTCRSGGLHS